MNDMQRMGWADKALALDAFLCAKRGDSEGLRAALSAGADPNAFDSVGATPLHWAADHGREDALRLLIQRGVSVDALDDDGCSPLMFAAAAGHLACALALADAGAKIDAVDRKGRSALDIAHAEGRHQIVMELVSRWEAAGKSLRCLCESIDAAKSKAAPSRKRRPEESSPWARAIAPRSEPKEAKAIVRELPDMAALADEARGRLASLSLAQPRDAAPKTARGRPAWR